MEKKEKGRGKLSLDSSDKEKLVDEEVQEGVKNGVQENSILE